MFLNNSLVRQKTARNRVESESNCLFFHVILVLVNKAKDRRQGQGLGQGLHSQGQGQGLKKCP